MNGPRLNSDILTLPSVIANSHNQPIPSYQLHDCV